MATTTVPAAQTFTSYQTTRRISISIPSSNSSGNNSRSALRFWSSLTCPSHRPWSAQQQQQQQQPSARTTTATTQLKPTLTTPSPILTPTLPTTPTIQTLRRSTTRGWEEGQAVSTPEDPTPPRCCRGRPSGGPPAAATAAVTAPAATRRHTCPTLTFQVKSIYVAMEKSDGFGI